MASDQTVTLVSRPAAADYSAYSAGEPTYQFLGFDIDTNGRAVLCSSNGQRCVGVLYNTPVAYSSGGEADLAIEGLVKLTYGGSVTAGDTLKVNSAGKFITATQAETLQGLGVAVALKTGSTGERHKALWIGNGGQSHASTETVAGTGGGAALSTSSRYSYITISGTVGFTLGSGLYDGQEKWIVCITAASTPNGTVTPGQMAEGSSHTLSFNAVGDAALLVWSANEATPTWHCISTSSVTIN